MSTTPGSGGYRVVIVGGGVAALEVALALEQLAPGLTDTTLIAPDDDFVYRPWAVGEPFSLTVARRYPLVSITKAAGAQLLCDEMDWVDHEKHMLHTNSGGEVEYDALVLALGAHQIAHYEHAITIDDSRMDETLHGLVQDIDGGYTKSLAFVSCGRMAWPLPLYELALMSAGRAYDAGIEMSVTIATPEDTPLQIFGITASRAVADLLERSRVQFMGSAYVEVPKAGEIVVTPGERHLRADHVIALPELEGPSVRGIPLGDHGFIRADPYGRVPDVEGVYAAGDATDFPIKHGGIAAQQADVVARSIAAVAGAAVTPERFHPVIRGMLLTDAKPVYLAARLTGGASFSSEITDAASWSPPGKIAALYLAPHLAAMDGENVERDESPRQLSSQTFDRA